MGVHGSARGFNNQPSRRILRYDRSRLLGLLACQSLGSAPYTLSIQLCVRPPAFRLARCLFAPGPGVLVLRRERVPEAAGIVRPGQTVEVSQVVNNLCIYFLIFHGLSS